MTPIDFATFLCLSGALFVGGYAVAKRARIARFVPVSRLGVFERDLPNLKKVVVLADRVESPEGTLREAVEDNLGESVQYLFLVSASKAEEEIRGYFLLFKALAERVLAQQGVPLSNLQERISELVQIRKLPYEWTDVPHIFYQFEKDSVLYTIGFRGNQRGEGIADFYDRLPLGRATSLAQALLAGAPEVIGPNLKVVAAPASLTIKGHGSAGTDA